MSRDASLDAVLAQPGDPGRTVAIGPFGEVSAARFRADVALAAAWIAAAPESAAALYHGDSYLFAVWLFACWHAGRAVILPADNLPATCTALATQTALTLGELAGARATAPPPGPASPLPLAPLDRQRVLLRVYTSGSTGMPVLIDKTIAQLEAEIAAIDAALGPVLPPHAAVAGTVGHQHIYGLLFRVLWPLATGRTLVSRIVRFPEELALLPRAVPSVLVSSPVFLMYLQGAAADAAGEARLCLLLSAGSSLAPAVARAAQAATGAPVYEIYGSSETGAVALRREPGADWAPLPGVGIRIAADGMLEVAAAQLDAGGWQRSADRARATIGGFELLGRADRLAKIGDKRVSLDRLESALAAGPLVAQAKAVVIPGARTELGAAVVLSDAGVIELGRHGRFALGRALRRELAGEFEAVVLPRRFRFVGALPGDALGKTRAADLLALFAAPHRRPAVTSREPGADSLRLRLEVDGGLECFQGHFPGQPIVPGVAQLEWAIGFAREEFRIATDFVGIEALKFQRIIAPGDTLTLTLEWRAGTTLVFRFESDGPHSSGRVLFAGAAA